MFIPNLFKIIESRIKLLKSYLHRATSKDVLLAIQDRIWFYEDLLEEILF